MEGDVEKSQDILWRIFPILDVVGTESAPKVEYYAWETYLVQARGFQTGEPRPPMRHLAEEAKRAIDNAYKDIGIYMDVA